MTDVNYIGIDIGKWQLEIYCPLFPELSGTYDNKIDVIRKFLLKLHEKSIRNMVICEGTAGYKTELRQFCEYYQIPCRVVNGARMREFAKASGQLAKTDKIDAKVIYAYANAFKLYANYEPTSMNLELRQLFLRYNQLVNLRKIEKNHLEAIHDNILKQNIEETIRYLSKQIKRCISTIEELIRIDEKNADNINYLRSIKGVGDITAIAALCYLPELGTLSNKQLAALAGVAPYEKESGNHSPGKHIKEGRYQLRQILYMAALTAIRSNPFIRKFYHKLRSQGKLAKVAIVACMRKLTTAMNNVIKEQRAWIN